MGRGYTLAAMRYDDGMRYLPAVILAGSVATIALACGGASDQDVFSASSTSSSSSSGTATTSSSGAPSTTSSGGGSTGSSSGGASTSSGSSGTPAADAGKPVPTTCTQESEINDSPQDADEFAVTGSACGTILAATDVDFLTFTLKSGTKSM